MRKYGLYILLFLYVALATFVLLTYNGTGDQGDSVMHYLFAKYAPAHPELFFNHWAKPLYVLLACPFAQFGMNGVKIFNVITVALTIFLTHQSVELLKLKNGLVNSIILIFMPLYFILTFSGLTEPLFALFVILGIYLVLKEKYFAACFFISFLPFVRSEGLIVIGVFGLYFLFKKMWQYWPVLLVGHIVYSIVGFFAHGNLLWVFKKIPYARMDSIYGQGEAFHFMEQLIYVIGVPITILFWIGMASIIWKSIKKKVGLEIQILIFLGFSCFFVAHTLFWYLGIFNSMGLKRVLVGIAPIISIVALMGFNFITEELLREKQKPRQLIQGLILIYLLIFPFTNNPAAIDWSKDLSLSQDQEAVIQVGDFIQKNVPENSRLIYAHPYIGEVLHVDPFDPNQKLHLTKDFMYHGKSGDIIIWENWFAVVEQKITKEQLDANPDLTPLYELDLPNEKRKIHYAVYKRN